MSKGANTSQFRSSLRDPCFLNFVSGIFALERTYDVMSSEKFENAYGHYLVTALFTLGFLAGLFANLSDNSRPILELLKEDKATAASFGFLFLGSFLLLLFVFIDMQVLLGC